MRSALNRVDRLLAALSVLNGYRTLRKVDAGFMPCVEPQRCGYYMDEADPRHASPCVMTTLYTAYAMHTPTDHRRAERLKPSAAHGAAPAPPERDGWATMFAKACGRRTCSERQRQGVGQASEDCVERDLLAIYISIYIYRRTTLLMRSRSLRQTAMPTVVPTQERAMASPWRLGVTEFVAGDEAWATLQATNSGNEEPRSNFARRCQMASHRSAAMRLATFPRGCYGLWVARVSNRWTLRQANATTCSPATVSGKRW